MDDKELVQRCNCHIKMMLQEDYDSINKDEDKPRSGNSLFSENLILLYR